MRTSTRILALAGPGLLVFAAATLVAQRGNAPATSSSRAGADATARIVASAQAVLKTLDDGERAKVQFPLEGPQRARWSNLPTGVFQRQGLRLADVTPAQRAAVMSLLRTALSKDGYQKVVDIMEGDEYYKNNVAGAPGNTPPNGGGPGSADPGAGRGRPAGGPGGGPGRGPGRGAPGTGGPTFGHDEYFLAFLGTPSATTPWMLQYGGHHLAINLTMVGDQATMAPSLPAAQPSSYPLEGRTIRPLGRETDKASALINGMDPAQRKQALIGSTVSDLVLGPGKDGQVIQHEGIRVSALSAAQLTLLMEIIREWPGIMNDAFGEPRMAEIKSKLAETYFAWSGPTAPLGAGYFRIQGPTLIIEFSPQGGPDHIHTIYRDPTNDYGERIARR